MKIDRLIGILAILLQKDFVTAPDWQNALRFPAGPSTGILKICAGQGFPLPQGRGREAVSG